MITIDKVKQHIALAEAAAAKLQNAMIPSKAARKETAKWIGVRNSLLQVVALLDTNPAPDSLERQHAQNVQKLSSYHTAKQDIPRAAKKVIADLDAQYNPTNLKKSLEFLNYILEKNDDLLCGVLSSASSLA